MMGSPTELLLVTEVHPTNFIALLFFKVGYIVTPQVWCRYTVAYDVNEYQLSRSFYLCMSSDLRSGTAYRRT